MVEEKKTQVIIDEEAFKDEESAYPGTTSSGLTEDQIKAMMEFRKEHELESKYPPFHYGYGHMSTTQLLALAKARKNVTIPNPNVNPQWSEITDDAIKFAVTISMEDDLGKIQAALNKFIEVDDSHSKFIRKALARSILKNTLKCRFRSKIDCKKMLEDREYSSDEIKEMINENYGTPKKFKLHPVTSFASIYVDYEGDGVK